MKSEPTSDDDVIRVVDVEKRYGGVQALVEVTLGFPRGSITAIVGDNGAGKSTLTKIMSGAEYPDRGVVHVNGKPLRFRSPEDAREAGIETVYQDLALADNLNAAENFYLGRELKVGWGLFTFLKHRAMESETEQVINQLGVRIPSVRVPVEGLSGGQRQGVAIARAANWGSDVIVMDEPTAALGVAETARVEEMIGGLRDRGLTIIIVSHNLDQVFRLADRVAVMRTGSLVDVVDARLADAHHVVSLITGLVSAVPEGTSTEP
jgi:ABC-type sugar transport system ATPase subunit